MLANIFIFITVGLWIGLVCGCFYSVYRVFYNYRMRNQLDNETVSLLENTLKNQDIDFSDINELKNDVVNRKTQNVYIKALKNKLYSHYLVGGIRGLFCTFFPKQYFIFNDLEPELEEVTNICLNMNATELSLTVLSMLSKIKPPPEFNDDNYDNESNSSHSDSSSVSHSDGHSDSHADSHSDSHSDGNDVNNSDRKDSKKSDKSSGSHSDSHSDSHADSSEKSVSSKDSQNVVTKPELVSKVLFTFIETFNESYKLENMKRSVLA